MTRAMIFVLKINCSTRVDIARNYYTPKYIYNFQCDGVWPVMDMRLPIWLGKPSWSAWIYWSLMHCTQTNRELNILKDNDIANTEKKIFRCITVTSSSQTVRSGNVWRNIYSLTYVHHIKYVIVISTVLELGYVSLIYGCA